MCLSPISFNHIAVGNADSHVRIYDRRYLSTANTSAHTIPMKTFTIPSATVSRPYRITSLNYSIDECELLVSYSSEHLYLLDVTRSGLDSVRALQAKPDIQRASQLSSTDSLQAVAAAAATTTSSSSTSTAPSVRRLRLRGDWSDTGPEARPERDMAARTTIGQARPQLQATIMHRMTEVLSRMLADPRTRIGLGGVHGGSASGELDVQHIAAAAEGNEPESEAMTTTTTTTAAEETDSESVPIKVDQPLEEDEEQPIKFDYLLMKFMGHRNSR